MLRMGQQVRCRAAAKVPDRQVLGTSVLPWQHDRAADRYERVLVQAVQRAVGGHACSQRSSIPSHRSGHRLGRTALNVPGCGATVASEERAGLARGRRLVHGGNVGTRPVDPFPIHAPARATHVNACEPEPENVERLSDAESYAAAVSATGRRRANHNNTSPATTIPRHRLCPRVIRPKNGSPIGSFALVNWRSGWRRNSIKNRTTP